MNLLFLPLPIRAFMSSSIIRTLSLGMCSTRDKNIIEISDARLITGIFGTVTRDECCAGVAVKYSTYSFSAKYSLWHSVIVKHID